MGWLSAGDGYEVALVEGRVAARAMSGRAAGRQLKSLPKGVREHPETERLRRFGEWLDRHAVACVAQVDTWMVSSLPVPTGLLARLWPDEAWQSALRDLAVVGDDPDEVGFLRDATDAGELRVVDLDGETVRLSPRTVTLPHPVLLPDLEDLREFAAELGVTQRVEQIHRATWLRPDGLAETATEIREFAGGTYDSRFGLATRATSLGYRVSGGYATCRVRDGGRGVEASVWIGEPYWDGDTETGSLTWSDEEGRTVRPSQVGPVAWSEGMRMAAALYAGRRIEKGNAA
ncbi:DUF4132 domain-containing protein [Streptomyces turgidiscabies]|uniref:DUF4132 domain-containing protein n=1 Tax=Streptomyces turgidiscabies (strain Car8) TaxID=698760 RepID=L7EUF3_STRT8|nr:MULTISPECIES: DUF4132 domain-containing protein [Streptomyces]ELP62647.1 hypothetical protein STRTUCAR8_08523 [Streptomyces turgidiscabies Car8]MDX3494974.1 DUF4132 domain-containing protein [Streptomyces turgidiscabies]GAQ70846.1 hypothetical protein T45_02587 [Streptomyces turgidiscabies]